MNVLLTAVGSMSALCAITKLHGAGHRVVGCDIYPRDWHYEAALCDVFARAPLAKAGEYVPFLVNLAKDNDVKYIFPLTDLEIDVINAHREAFEEAGLVACIPSRETLGVVRNKHALYEAFKEDGRVPSIPTFTSEDDLAALSYPCVAKPKDGRSSEGLLYLNDASQIENIKNIDNYIFQEKLAGNVCTVDFVRSAADGASFCVPREELLRTKNGAGTTVRVFHDEGLERLVAYIGGRLDVNGVVNMEFISHGGAYYLIDVNPRFSAGVAFSCGTGYDFINAHLACFTGKPIPKPVPFSEKIMVKYFVEQQNQIPPPPIK